ncbi:DNA mismatch repair protein MutT [Vallitalea longa]|uniref:DNA mismatch repair protein MutT n=1 Tax=Vallitalea longa TaxID=2936439 RepID=A0A9W5Y9Z0_9FIRM|nr:NUDIX hydrolase [Vallitalea longa]GKX30055.1 DNA mismatch repair protein MutT [Vallitalea longa]
MSDYIHELRKEVGNRPIILSTSGAVLIDNNNRFLMQHRTDNDTWGLPGGVIELGETVEEAARREVFEETGLTAYDLKLFNIYSGEDQHYTYPNGDEVYYICITYYTRTYEGKIKIDGIESKDIRFFDVNNLPKNISKPVKCIVNDIVNKITNESV